MKTKLYEIGQNNSGGYFDVDENVCRIVVVEARDAEHAQQRLWPMIDGQSSSCPCCGERWSIEWLSEADAISVEPGDENEYFQRRADEWGWTAPAIRVHYLDGTKKEFFSKQSNKQ